MFRGPIFRCLDCDQVVLLIGQSKLFLSATWNEQTCLGRGPKCHVRELMPSDRTELRKSRPKTDPRKLFGFLPVSFANLSLFR